MGCGQSSTSAPMMAKNKGGKPKLQYFDMHGRACHIRMTLWYCGIDYEDCRLSFPEFGKLKGEGAFTFGSAPDLDIDGIHLDQSMAITRYLGSNKPGMKNECLYPGKTNPEQSYAIDLCLEEQAE